MPLELDTELLNRQSTATLEGFLRMLDELQNALTYIMVEKYPPVAASKLSIIADFFYSMYHKESPVYLEARIKYVGKDPLEYITAFEGYSEEVWYLVKQLLFPIDRMYTASQVRMHITEMLKGTDYEV